MIPTRRNSESKKSLRLQEIAELVGGELLGDPKIEIWGVAGIKEGQEGDITFLSNSKYLPFLEETHASAIITSKDIVSNHKPLIRTSNPSQAFSKVISFFVSSSRSKKIGVHPTAVIDPSVHLGKNISIGPHVVIEKDSNIGDESVIEANVFIGEACAIGEAAHIYPNVSLREKTQIGNRVIIHNGTVIGSDGFGYETIEGEHLKIPHTGFVVIEDDVEIGANVCVDRGRFDKTWIKKGTKVDNLVQIAHNVVIGENCLIMALTGLSGSTELGNKVILAGQVGTVGHIRIGDGVIVGAQAGVTKSIPDNTVFLGSPATPAFEQKRMQAAISKLPELLKEFAAFKKNANLPPKNS